MNKTRIGIATAILSLGCVAFSPAGHAQQGPHKQKQGVWSEEICRQNAIANGYRGGADFCAEKAKRVKEQGKRKVTR